MPSGVPALPRFAAQPGKVRPNRTFKAVDNVTNSTIDIVILKASPAMLFVYFFQMEGNRKEWEAGGLSNASGLRPGSADAALFSASLNSRLPSLTRGTRVLAYWAVRVQLSTFLGLRRSGEPPT